VVRFIGLSFLFLGWAFYELSGGNDFEPQERNVPEVQIVAQTDLPETAEIALDAKPVAALPAAATTAPQPLVTLASVPTTKRLVGTPKPTAVAEIAKLGPAKVDPQPQTATAQDTQAIVARASLAFEEPDFRRVTGNRVNMRNGPGTQYSVIGKLIRDSEVEILQEPGNGWVKLQALETGRIGWMSAKLLAKIQN
jgi:hypothetical protein